MDVAIAFRHVKKTFNKTSKDAVKDVTLDIEQGSFVVLLGASGSGKTTLLKMVNGVIPKTQGEIYINGQEVGDSNMISLRRGMGYVIQQTGLFPHMTIFENISTVPKLLKWSEQKIAERVDELLHLMKLPPKIYKDRYPRELSGGQQQRVGIARALAANPDILLMDEPFASLDALTRSDLQDELLRIQKDYHKTILFVSHDIGEAIKLADKIIVMGEGEVLQYDSPYNIVNHPKHPSVVNLIKAFESFTKPYAAISRLCGED